MQRRLGAALMGPASAAPPCAAIGKNMVNAKTFLEKRYSEDMELEDAIHTALLTLKEGFEGESGRGRAGWGRVRGHPRSSWLCACLGTTLRWLWWGRTASSGCSPPQRWPTTWQRWSEGGPAVTLRSASLHLPLGWLPAVRYTPWLSKLRRSPLQLAGGSWQGQKDWMCLLPAAEALVPWQLVSGGIAHVDGLNRFQEGLAGVRAVHDTGRLL